MFKREPEDLEDEIIDILSQMLERVPGGDIDRRLDRFIQRVNDELRPSRVN